MSQPTDPFPFPGDDAATAVTSPAIADPLTEILRRGARDLLASDVGPALESLLGPGCPGLSAKSVERLKNRWIDEHRAWSKRDLAGKHYVYVWADAVHFGVRLGHDAGDPRRVCVLVMIGATEDGTKELIAVKEAVAESELSWSSLLTGLKGRGLCKPPKLAVADGAGGFWAAMRKVFPQTVEQRCTVHKTANVLDKMHKKVQPGAKSHLHAIWQAPDRETAGQEMDRFREVYDAKYPKAVACLLKDREALLAFFDFPAEHWRHLRSTNAIESTFATVRLRTQKTKGCGSVDATLSMVYKLCESAATRWRKLNGHALIPDVIEGVVFTNGVAQAAA